MKHKKLIISTFILFLAFAFSAQAANPNYFLKRGTTISLLQDSWSFGDASHPIAGGRFTELTVDTLTIGAMIATGDIDMGGNNINNAGDITAEKIVATSTSETSMIATGGFTVGTDQFVVAQTTGEVGIGTSSPFSKLSVAGDTYLGGNLTATGTVVFDNALGVYYGGSGLSSISDGHFLVGTGGNALEATSTLFMDAEGDVGVGTITPVGRFNVNGGNFTLTGSDSITVNPNGMVVSAGVNNANFYQRGNGDGDIDHSLNFLVHNGKITFSSGSGGGTTAMTIDNDGNIGISTTTPEYDLEVQGGLRTDNLALDNNVETLADNKTLVATDSAVQKLDPDGTDRNITLPAEANSEDLTFLIFNTAGEEGEDLVIYDDTPTALDTVGFGHMAIITCDGTTWNIMVICCSDSSAVLNQRVKEENTSNIVIGQPVYISGATGVAFPNVGLADADDASKIRIEGLAAEAITQNTTGFVRLQGLLEGVDSSKGGAVNPLSQDWVAGDQLWVSTTAGGLTNVRPTSGRSIKVGTALTVEGTNSKILVDVQENHVWNTAAAAEDVVLRVGDDIGVNKVSIRNFSNSEVAYFDSLGNLVVVNATSTQATSTISHIGKLTLDNVLDEAYGGTGTSSPSGILKGDGTSIVTAVAGVDYLVTETGTVSSVAMTVPTGYTITGSPITSSGTLALAYDTGYAAVKTASTTNWNGFYDTPSTVISAGTGLSWTGNTLNAEVQSSDLHDAVTLAGEDFLSLSTQQITANAINPDNLANTDFGDFSCNGTTCTLDSSYGNVFLSGTPVDNQLAIWTNATTVEGVAGLTFDGTNLLGVGQNDVAIGTISLFGDNTTNGGLLKFFNAASEDTTEDYFAMEVNENNFYMGYVSDTDQFIFSNAGNFTATGNIAGATYASDGSVSDTELKYINSLSSNAQDQLDNKWDALSDMSLTLGQMYIGDSSNHPTATSTLFIHSNSYVGVGTSTPAYKLDIFGDLRVDGNIRIQDYAYFAQQYDYGTKSTNFQIDLANGNKQQVTLGAAGLTVTWASSTVSNILLEIHQDGTGSRTITDWSGVKWAGGEAPTLTTDLNAIDIISCFSDGTDVFCTASLDFK